MVAFEARDQRQVRALHAAALAAGGSDEGAPGFRAAYVPLVWQGRPRLAAPFAHVRRDLVRAAPGLAPVEEDGRLVRLRVRPGGG